MSGVSEDFQAHLDREVTTLCHCWTVARADGVALGFTDHDRPLDVDGIVHQPQTGMTATEARDTIGLAGDATDIEGALSSDAISETDISAGRYDGARVTTRLVNWRDPGQHVVIRTATVGTITRSDGAFRVELNGPAAALETRVGRFYRRTCDAQLGDLRCGFDLTQAGFHGAGAVTIRRGAGIEVSGLDAFADGWFACGRLTWTSGERAGRTVLVAGHRQAGGRTLLTLDDGAVDVAAGDTFTIEAGCDKRFETCRTKFANRLNFRGFPQNLERVALVVTWFGDDLRAGECAIYPAVVEPENPFAGTSWSVNGVTPADARLVSDHGGGAAYGGTPSDRSVVQAIEAIKARGWAVTLYPFVMMDVPNDNVLPDPHGGERQAAYPWRGRITCFPGPGQEGSADRTASARTQVASFCGAATAGDFVTGDATVIFSGDPDDWGYRRMVIHYAHLAEVAGGVDAFLIGSELRGLTTLRDGGDAFPFVEKLVEIAGDVRAILRPTSKITYAADWSEYFGHHPASGDVFFHLDPLWASDAVDAVGIDTYMPLSDWRDEDCAGGNPDGFASPYDRQGLRRAIASGEGFDWYYASDEARRNRSRTPITDGLAAKPWVFRYKDLKGWWSNLHFDRVGGVEAAEPTAWVPESKPFWLTEVGCAAVDKGPNQPNVFPDPKSSENALPHHSSGGRSDLAQRRFLEAHLAHWTPGSDGFLPTHNPISGIYGGRMVDPGRIYAWAWDARPFPAFPLERDTWRDGENWLNGHWLNGRLGSVDVSDLVEALASACGLEVDARGADGIVAGYVLPQPGSGRDALSPVVELFDLAFDASGDVPRFATIGAVAGSAISIADPVSAGGDGAAIELVRPPDLDIPTEALLSHADPLDDYRSGVGRAVRSGGQSVAHLDMPAATEPGHAEALASDWLRRAWASRETARFSVPAKLRAPRPGSLVALPGRAEGEFVVSAVEEGLTRRIEARRVVRVPPTPDRARLPPRRARHAPPGAPLALFLDLPGAGGEAPHDRFKVAAFAKPWVTQQVHASPGDTGFELRATLTRRATAGQLVEPLPPGREGRLDRFGALVVRLYAGELASVPLLQMLNGANVAAVRSATGVWEVVQFAATEEIEPGVWRLGDLLRGQLGTNDAASAGCDVGADFVLLDAAVQAAGLRAGEAGLELNWRVTPAGKEFGLASTVTQMHVGGVRAALPLSPAHLSAARQPDGAFALAWIRRGRMDADSWHGIEIPRDEPFETYVIRVRGPDGPVVRQATVESPSWVYSAASLAADFPDLPAYLDLDVRQVGQGGEGIPARLVVATGG